MRKMKVLVTGGVGFIGSHLVERLVKEGHKVVIIDNLSNGSNENLKGIEYETWWNIDISSWHLHTDFYETIPEPIDVIYHLACFPRSMSFDNPQRDVDVNIKGMVNVLELARKNDSLVIFSSNSGIYDTSKMPVTEETSDNPKSPYDLDKLTAEKYLKLYYDLYGIEYVIFRFATVYGERQKVTEDWKPVVMTFIDKTLKNEPLEIHGGGRQTRDFIYVSDIVDALVNVLEKYEKKRHYLAMNQTMLLGTGVETSIMELAKMTDKICGNIAHSFIYKPLKLGDIMRMRYPSEKARRILNWKPQVELEEGIKRIVGGYLGKNC